MHLDLTLGYSDICRELISTLIQEFLVSKLLADNMHMLSLLLTTKLLVCMFKFKVLCKFQNPMLFLWSYQRASSLFSYVFQFL